MKAKARLAFLATTAAALLLVSVSQSAAAPVPGDPCPNGDIRHAQGVAHLPDCMALEQVSPQFKDNQPARIRSVTTAASTAVDVGSISVNGERVRFRSTAALGGTTGNLSAFGDWYVATRDDKSGQWETSHTNPPVGLTMGWSSIPFAEAFNADLSHWFQIAAIPADFEVGLGQVFRGGLGGKSLALSPLLASLSGTPEGVFGSVRTESRGSSADSSHLYFSTGEPIGYLPGDPLPAGSGAFRNTYVAQLDSNGDPSLELLARDGNGKVWGANCGAQLAGGHSLFTGIQRNRGAISADGFRTYFSARPSQPAGVNCDTASNKLRILKRIETTDGPWISELISPECDRVANLPAIPACGTTGPSGTPVPDADDVYEGASIEGSKVYLTTTRQLTSDDVDAATDLYLYDASRPFGGRLANLSGPGTATPSVSVISGDGSNAYFTSTDVITSGPGPDGKVAQAGQTNLYVYDAVEEEVNFIATTNPASPYPVPVLGPDPTKIGVGGDGHLLFFSSSAALTGDDLDGSKSDIFRYEANTGTLTRISKAAPGGTDNESVNTLVVGLGLGSFTDTATRGTSPELVTAGRWVSEDGETISFKTQEALLPSDDNGVLDSYILRNGQLYRLPGTADSTNGLDLDGGLQDGPLVSPRGESIAFQTFEQLLGRDRDTAIDVYALRVDGGFPEPPEPAICPPDSSGGCQGPADGPIGEASGASASLIGPGNVKPKGQKRCPKGKRLVRRKGKARCANRKAAKHAKRTKRNRTANTDRRAGK